MIYSINDFEDFLSVFHEMSKMTPEDCINKLMYKTYGTFNYYLPGVSERIIKNEIQNNSVTDLLFYGTGNGIWIKNLNIKENYLKYITDLEKISRWKMINRQSVWDCKLKR